MAQKRGILYVLLAIGILMLGSGVWLLLNPAVQETPNAGSQNNATPTEATSLFRKSVVQVKAYLKGGDVDLISGFVFDTDGRILTYHMDASEVERWEVILNDGRSFEASLFKTYEVWGFTCIRIEASDLTPIRLIDYYQLYPPANDAYNYVLYPYAMRQGLRLTGAGYNLGQPIEADAAVQNPNLRLTLNPVRYPKRDFPVIKLNHDWESGVVGGLVVNTAGLAVGQLISVEPETGESYMVTLDLIKDQLFEGYTPGPVIREYSPDVVKAVYEEIQAEIHRRPFVPMQTGYSGADISLGYLGQADPELVDIAMAIVDSKLPGLRLLIGEYITPLPVDRIPTDSKPSPVFEIQSPQNGAELKTNLIKVIGISPAKSPAAVVTVNNQKVVVAEDGSFSAYIELVKGLNRIGFRAQGEHEIQGQTIEVTFTPALAVYMEYPYPGDRSIDYTKQPITITGFINYPEAKVTVNGIEARVEQNGNFSASIQLKEGGNSIQAVAKLGGKEDEITYSVLLSAEGKLNPIPGLGSGGTRYQSRVTFDQSILIKAGETKLIDVTLEVKKDIRGPEAFKYSISNAGVEYGRDQLTMPEGFDASIEPFEFTAYPNTRYDSALTIKTNTQIVPGEYWLRLDWTLENGSRGSGWIEVSVQR